MATPYLYGNASRLEQLLITIAGELLRIECKEFPKGFICQRAGHSVEFTLPFDDGWLLQTIEWQVGDSIEWWYAADVTGYTDKIVIRSPFSVESLGRGKFIARDAIFGAGAIKG